MMKNFDVVGIGQCAWDCISLLEKFPQPDSKTELAQIIMQGGGPVATALVALQRWGFQCSFGGVVGDDYFGQQTINSIKNEGVDIREMIIRHGFESQFAFILADRKGGQRTIFWRRPTGAPPQPAELNLALIEHAKIFYTDGLFTEASIAAAKIAQKAGIPVIVDAGTLREGMLNLAQYSDYYIVSEVFADALVEKHDPKKACYELKKTGCPVVGVTLGENGYVAYNGEQWIEGRAYQVDSIDTTGCGDLFHAGIACGVLQNWPLKKTLDFAAWAAAQVSLYLGGRQGIPPIRNYPAFRK